MHSAVTGRPASRPSNFMSQKVRSVVRGLVSVLLVVLLSACSTGDVDESRLAETREATRGAVLPDVQATNVIKEFFPPTGTPGPTYTPAPTLATLTLTTQISSNNQPRNEVGSVRSGGTVYAVAEIHNLSAGQVVTAIWATPDGAEIGRTEVQVDRSISAAWVPLQWTANVGAGTYAVYIYVDSEMLNSLVFRVT